MYALFFYYFPDTVKIIQYFKYIKLYNIKFAYNIYYVQFVKLS